MKKNNRNAKRLNGRAKEYKDNLRVLSTTTPEKLVKAVVSGAGFTKQKPRR